MKQYDIFTRLWGKRPFRDDTPSSGGQVSPEMLDEPAPPHEDLHTLDKACRPENKDGSQVSFADDSDGALFELRPPFKFPGSFWPLAGRGERACKDRSDDKEQIFFNRSSTGEDSADTVGAPVIPQPESAGLEHSAEKDAEKQPVHRFLGELYDWVDAVTMAFVLVILLFTFVLRVVKVDGISMLPTLKDRDNVVIYNVNYQPAPGDIVVLTLDKPVPGIGDKPLIKRIIAVGGQTVDFDFTTATLIIDGKPQKEPYIAQEMSPTVFASYQGQLPLTVPQGQIFFLGDNRNESFDSSESVIGCVDARHIMGKVFFRIFPLGSFGTVKGNGE